MRWLPTLEKLKDNYKHPQPSQPTFSQAGVNETPISSDLAFSRVSDCRDDA